MILTIVLKSQDAMGLGGDILFDAGLTPDMNDPQMFTGQLSGHGDEGVDIIERLLDNGIKPVRVIRTERPYTVVSSSKKKFDPMQGRPKPQKLDLF